MKYYICHKGRRLLGPFNEREAMRYLFELRGTFSGIYIEVVDDSGKVIRRIPRR